MGKELDPYPDSASKSQRSWIIERDEGHCQMPVAFVPHTGVILRVCGREGEEVHHIWPKKDMVYNTGKDPHTRENLIYLCRFHHLTFIHPDVIEALRDRKMGDKFAIEKLMERRFEMCIRGIPYWITKWDYQLKAIANARNNSFDKKNPHLEYPKTRFPGQTGYAY